MAISLGYPAADAEMKILKGETNRDKITNLPALLTKEELALMQNAVDKIHASDALLSYILRIAEATRSEARFTTGISPRGSVALLKSAKAYAFIAGRDYIVPEDVKAVLPSVVEHRLRQIGQQASSSRDLVHWLLENIPSVQ